MTPGERHRAATCASGSPHDALLDALLSELESAASESTRLTSRQLEELDGLRDELVRLCRRGETERARRAAAMAVAIARRGSSDED